MNKELPKEILRKHLADFDNGLHQNVLAAMEEYATLRAKPLVDSLEVWSTRRQMAIDDNHSYGSMMLLIASENELLKALSSYKEGIDQSENK